MDVVTDGGVPGFGDFVYIVLRRNDGELAGGLLGSPKALWIYELA